MALAAAETLDAVRHAALAGFLARADVPDTMRARFVACGVRPATTASTEDEPLVETETELPEIATASDADNDVPQIISDMSVIDRMKLAMKGTREQRSVLVRDANKLVASAVISSPKLNDSEVETYARMTNVSEEVLRLIGNNRSWMRNYAISSSLAKNPKTPVAMSLRLVQRLNARDVKGLTRDRNVPDALRQAAKRIVDQSESRH